MLRATRDIFADKDNKIVSEQSTVSGTFKVAAAGAALDEKDAARYDISPDKYAQHGLEAIPAAPPSGSGFGLDNSAQTGLSQGVTMGAGHQPQRLMVDAPTPQERALQTEASVYGALPVMNQVHQSSTQKPGTTQKTTTPPQPTPPKQVQQTKSQASATATTPVAPVTNKPSSASSTAVTPSAPSTSPTAPPVVPPTVEKK